MWSVKSGCGARAADCIRSNADQSCIIDWRSEDQMATRSSDEARCRRVLVGSPEHQRSEAPNINGRKPRTSTVGSPEHQRSEAICSKLAMRVHVREGTICCRRGPPAALRAWARQ